LLLRVSCSRHIPPRVLFFFDLLPSLVNAPRIAIRCGDRLEVGPLRLRRSLGPKASTGWIGLESPVRAGLDDRGPATQFSWSVSKPSSRPGSQLLRIFRPAWSTVSGDCYPVADQRGWYQIARDLHGGLSSAPESYPGTVPIKGLPDSIATSPLVARAGLGHHALLDEIEPRAASGRTR